VLIEFVLYYKVYKLFFFFCLRVCVCVCVCVFAFVSFFARAYGGLMSKHVNKYIYYYYYYYYYYVVVGLERGPLSLVCKTEELLGRNSSGSGLENREYGSGNPLR
jgi:hypothetical protein